MKHSPRFYLLKALLQAGAEYRASLPVYGFPDNPRRAPAQARLRLWLRYEWAWLRYHLHLLWLKTGGNDV